jgi:hypothetical protein
MDSQQLWQEQAERHYESLRSELIQRGVEDARVENSGGGVMVVTGTLPNGWTVDATAQGFAFSFEDGNLAGDYCYTLLPNGEPDYDALAIEDADEQMPYSGTINEDSAAMAAHVILTAYAGACASLGVSA